MTANDYKPPEGGKLTLARYRAKHDVETAANSLGVSRTTWWRWESGAKPMPKVYWEYYQLMTGQHPLKTLTNKD